MRKSRRAFLILIFMEIVILLFLAIRARKDIVRVDAQLEKVHQEILKIEEENERLKKMENKLSDPFFREKLAREKLGLARKGEIVYLLVPEKVSP